MRIVSVRNIERYRQEIIAGDHAFFADEPINVGGDDTGPDPYELLLGALGACTAMTVRMYAQRKGWDLQEIEVELTHNHTYAKDGEDGFEKDVKLDRITFTLMVSGNLDDAQRKRLREIARRCPVHQTLTTGYVEIVDKT
jgi:uncharacterized OsmC-like protein